MTTFPEITSKALPTGIWAPLIKYVVSSVVALSFPSVLSSGIMATSAVTLDPLVLVSNKPIITVSVFAPA